MNLTNCLEFQVICVLVNIKKSRIESRIYLREMAYGIHGVTAKYVLEPPENVDNVPVLLEV